MLRKGSAPSYLRRRLSSRQRVISAEVERFLLSSPYCTTVLPSLLVRCSSHNRRLSKSDFNYPLTLYSALYQSPTLITNGCANGQVINVSYQNLSISKECVKTNPLVLNRYLNCRFHCTKSVGRFNVSFRLLSPLIYRTKSDYNSLNYNFAMRSKRYSLSNLVKFPSLQRRYMTSSSSGGGGKHGLNRIHDKNGKNNEKEASDESAKSSVSGTSGSRLNDIVEKVKKGIPKMEWHLSDLVSVWGIGILFLSIVCTPIVLSEMRASNNQYNDIEIEDAIRKQMERVHKEMSGNMGIEDGDDEDDEMYKSAGNTVDVIADVLNSEALQNAIASLIAGVMDSSQFQNASKKLLKNLWDDLVNDPETTAQVVQLLNNAIQNDQIKHSFKKLVMEILEDDEVYNKLTGLVVQLGEEKEVLDATQALLTESAHKALNDSEILDHSMEFATDVVGDDVVQRTSGEALRNTVTYAVRPSFSAFFSTLGVGLLIFSVSAFQNARLSAKDGKNIDASMSVVAKTLGNFTTSFVREFLSIPVRILSSLGSKITSILKLPFSAIGYIIYPSVEAGTSIMLTMKKLGGIVCLFPRKATKRVSTTCHVLVSVIRKALEFTSHIIKVGIFTVGSLPEFLFKKIVSSPFFLAKELYNTSQRALDTVASTTVGEILRRVYSYFLLSCCFCDNGFRHVVKTLKTIGTSLSKIPPPAKCISLYLRWVFNYADFLFIHVKGKISFLNYSVRNFFQKKSNGSIDISKL